MRALRLPGSSPRMRGKRRWPLDKLPQTTAHPRACGENTLSNMQTASFLGSSPRMRGKREAAARNSQGAGLIPAHAGKTPWPPPVRFLPQAHPRACGENEETNAGDRRTLGSSPRMRGKRWMSCDDPFTTGLIPAHAGKTWRVRKKFCHRAAHPRACGENGCCAILVKHLRGSSPRMRGKRAHEFHGRRALGLIPAHAGKTMARAVSVCPLWAHPRACGENLGKMFFQIAASGSSPRMRGKRLHLLLADREGRLIPAHAGKTLTSCIMLSIASAHPRACGENCGGKPW